MLNVLLKALFMDNLKLNNYILLKLNYRIDINYKF
jgi:hypothetical protein